MTDSRGSPGQPCTHSQHNRPSPSYYVFPLLKWVNDSGAPISPVITNSTNRRQPVDSEGLVGLPNNHWWDGYGGRLSGFTPLLIYEVQIAMHPGHLVWGEVVRAVIICREKKGGVKAVTGSSAQSTANLPILTLPCTQHLAFVRLTKY